MFNIKLEEELEKAEVNKKNWHCAARLGDPKKCPIR